MKVPEGYKRCKCRDENGRELGRSCPRLKRKNGSWNPSHGTWYGKMDVPAPEGKREALRAGGFATQDGMQGWFKAAIGLLEVPRQGSAGHEARAEILAVIREARRKGEPLPDLEAVRLRHATGAAQQPGTLGEYLLAWLARHEGARDLKPTTLKSYRDSVMRWWLPLLGHIPLDQLSADDILRVIAAIDAEADRIRAAAKSADPEVRKSVAGRRPPGLTTKRNHLAVIAAALGEAATPAPGRPRLLAASPAAGIKLGARSGKRQARAPRSQALLWTPEREARWRREFEKRAAGLDQRGRYWEWKRTSGRPSNVMVWRPEHVTAFLDHPGVQEHRLSPLFETVAYCGLRRGEAVGLEWENVDWDASALMIGGTIVQVGWAALAQDSAKSEGSRDWVSIEEEVTDALRAARRMQAAERLAWGPAWRDTGLVFTQEDGSAWHPAQASACFYRLSYMAGVPPIRLHDLRHVAATLALAGGTDIRVVAAMMRHSSHVITGELYALVLPELAKSAAAAVSSMVPRRRRREAVG